MPTIAELAPSLASTPPACAHCGQPAVATGAREQDRLYFCCAGCETVFGILHHGGLEQYYRLPQKRSQPVRAAKRTFDEFDHHAFASAHQQDRDDGISCATLQLRGLECASCVWLIERLPRLMPGVQRAEVDLTRAAVIVEWDRTVTRLSGIARMLTSIGYEPYPFLGMNAERARRKEDRDGLVRIGVAGALAANVMLISLGTYSGWVTDGVQPDVEHFFRWVSLSLVIPSLFGPGRVFFRSAWGALRAGSIHLDLPIAIALAAAFARGTVNTIANRGPLYLDGIAVLIFLLLVGRYLKQRWQRAAVDASALAYALTPNACRLVDPDAPEGTRELPVAAIVPGMELLVRAGDIVGADGVVVDGSSTVNMAWLTGESTPLSVGPGEPVYAGTLNVTAPLRVQVLRAGEESRAARVLRQVEESARRRPPVVLFADRIAGWFVIVVLALAAITYLAWVGRDAALALDHAVALLVVTCPCALAMATPLSITVALGRAARAGIFVKGGDTLESLAHAGHLYLDKTGTITAAQTALMRFTGPDWVKPGILGLEQGSLHPIAEGFRRAWPGIAPGAVSDVQHEIGHGITGTCDGHRLVVGSEEFVSAQLGSAEPSTEPRAQADARAAMTVVWIAVDGVLLGTAAFHDPIRPGAAAAVTALRRRGWRVAMLSGDAPSVVRAVAAAVGIEEDTAFSRSTPEAKRDVVLAARSRNPVVMVGDGVNDAIALAAADVGVAVHGGAEVAMRTADVYLTEPGLDQIVTLVDGAQRTMRVIRRNMLFSLGYNVVGVVLAITGTINPLIAAILMPVSSLTVVAGAWAGRTFPRR